MTEQQKLYAGFWPRLAAYIIDNILLFIPSYCVNILVFLLTRNFTSTNPDIALKAYLSGQVPYSVFALPNIAGMLVLSSVIAWFIAKHKWQGTPGKRIMKLYVANIDGSRLSYKTAFLRSILPVSLHIVALVYLTFAAPSSFPGIDFKNLGTSGVVQICTQLVFIAWYMVIFFTPERTAVHDIIAKTRVLKGRV